MKQASLIWKPNLKLGSSTSSKHNIRWINGLSAHFLICISQICNLNYEVKQFLVRWHGFSLVEMELWTLYFFILFLFVCKYNNHFQVIKYFSVEKQGVFCVYILGQHTLGDTLRAHFRCWAWSVDKPLRVYALNVCCRGSRQADAQKADIVR